MVEFCFLTHFLSCGFGLGWRSELSAHYVRGADKKGPKYQQFILLHFILVIVGPIPSDPNNKGHSGPSYFESEFKNFITLSRVLGFPKSLIGIPLALASLRACPVPPVPLPSGVQHTTNFTSVKIL